MKSICKMIILILATTMLLTAQTWNHVLSDYSIIDIVPYDGGYWVATESNGAFRYDTSTDRWYRYNQENGIMSQNDNINDMKIMGGKVWFATNYGIYICSTDGGSWQHKLLPGDIYSNWVRGFDATSDKVYIAGFTGLFTYSFSTNSFTEIGNLKPDYYQTSYTNSIFATDSVVWIGTDDGVFKYDTSLPISDDASITYYSKDNGIPTGSDLVMCRSLYANEQGLWLGLDEYTSTQAPNYCLGGLFSFDGQNWTKYDESTGLPADGIHFIQEYDHKIYAGLFNYVDGVNFDGAGLLVLDLTDLSWRVLDDSNWYIGNDSVRSFYCTETDTLVGTDHGLFTTMDLPGLAPFDAPEWFSVRSLGDQRIEIIVDPVYLADGYRVLLSVDGVNYNLPYTLMSTSGSIGELENDRLYYVQVSGMNVNGLGPTCKDILCVRTSTTVNDILLVQAFDNDVLGNDHDLCRLHAELIADANISLDAISDEALLETDIDPNEYDMIDWICGVDNNVLITESKQIISSYLESGGKLFISGSQLIEGVTGANYDAEFYNEYLKAAWKKSDAGTYDVETIASGIFNGIEDFSFDDGSHILNVGRPDGFDPLDGAETSLFYAEKDSSSYGVAALQYTGTFGQSTEEAQLVYMGFPFEGIVSESIRNAIMLCVLDYFDFDVIKTSIQVLDTPETVELLQNYPNPFNPITKITFLLPVNDHINISIYDLNGRFVANLISEYKSAGNHEVFFNASDLSSGVYICRLKSGEHVRSMKMLLMK